MPLKAALRLACGFQARQWSLRHAGSNFWPTRYIGAPGRDRRNRGCLQPTDAAVAAHATVTNVDDFKSALLKYLRADGPPTVFIVETASGGEYSGTRSVGSFRVDHLLRRLQPFG